MSSFSPQKESHDETEPDEETSLELTSEDGNHKLRHSPLLSSMSYFHSLSLSPSLPFYFPPSPSLRLSLSSSLTLLSSLSLSLSPLSLSLSLSLSFSHTCL